MRALRAWLIRLTAALTPGRREREMADEFESHLQLHIDDNVRAGMSLDDARRDARLKFGAIEAIKEDYRDRGGLPVASRVVQDLRFAMRLLRKAPAFSLTAIVTIALAVAANAAIFTVLNAAALQALPVPGGDRLVSVSLQLEGGGRRNVSGGRSMLSFPEYAALREQTRSFEDAIAYAPTNEVTLDGAEPRVVLATLASCNFFDVLQVRPVLGRGLTAADCAKPGAGNVAVLTHKLWTSAFGADPAIVGRVISINRTPFVIVGIAPAGFHGTEVVEQSMFVPVTMQTAVDRGQTLLADANVSWLMVVGRLARGASLSSLRTDLAVVAGRLTAADQTGRRYYLNARRATLAALPEARTLVLGIGTVLLAAVTLVLLIACANIANLLIARATFRRREIAVRMALGASRRRIAQQLLTESLLLAAIGGGLGVLAASWASQGAVAYILAHLPPGAESLVFDPRPDARVILYALALTVTTGLAFGLVPAWQSTRRDPASEVRDSAATDRRSSRRMQSVLVGVQVAVCLILLLSAGLLARGLHRAETIEPGLRMDGVTVLSYDLTGAGYDEARAAAFQRQVLERLERMPGLRAVAQANPLPLSSQYRETRFSFPGGRPMYMEFGLVTPGYFDVLGIPVVRGRNFTAQEVQAESAAIVTESTARHLWPGEDPLTKALTLDDSPRPVVGVVRDAQVARLGVTNTDYVFLPAGPTSQQRLHILAAAAPGGPARGDLRAAVSALDPQLAVTAVRLSDNLEGWRAPAKLGAVVAGTLAAFALLLACTGVFGTVAYAVSRRVREIGIRVALGAAREDVLTLIVRQAMRPVLIGMAVGLAGAAAVSKVLDSLLFGLSPHDPLAFVAATLVLLASALLACYIPARRALRVDPTTALRVE